MSVYIEPVSEIIAELDLEENGNLNYEFAGECMRRMDKYVPKDEGVLRDEAYVDDECCIVYNQEYAGYQYYGQREDGSHKVKNYTTPETGPYWDRLMVSAESNELLQYIKDYYEEK